MPVDTQVSPCIYVSHWTAVLSRRLLIWQPAPRETYITFVVSFDHFLFPFANHRHVTQSVSQCTSTVGAAMCCRALKTK